MTTSRQFSTFKIGNRLYGIDVMKVQEVTQSMPMSSVPLAPNYVHGLINLRGQIATAVSLRELFDLQEKPPESFMNVVCRGDGFLLSLLVDEIGDVMGLEDSEFEPAPETIPENIRMYMSGIYKIEGNLLSVINIDKVVETMNN